MRKATAVLGSALFFVVAPFLAAGVIPWWINRWEFRPAFFDLQLTRAIGVILKVAGVPGVVDSFARFALQGLGTPAPVAPPQHLVVTGLYRRVRNPNVRVGCCYYSWSSAPVRGLAAHRLRRSVLVGVPCLRAVVRRADAEADIRPGVRGLSRERPALDSAP